MRKEDLQVGDVVKIRYTEDVGSKAINTILITNRFYSEGKLNITACWYEKDEYDGRNYVISPYQEIIKLVKSSVNVKKVLAKAKRLEVNLEN